MKNLKKIKINIFESINQNEVFVYRLSNSNYNDTINLCLY